MSTTNRMTLSIQLIDDSGEALIDSVIQGETNELRGELGRLFKGTEIFNISDLSPALQTEFVQQSANLTQRGAARAPRSRPDTTSTTSTTTATAGGKEEAPVYSSDTGFRGNDDNPQYPHSGGNEKGFRGPVQDQASFVVSGANQGKDGGERTGRQVYGPDGTPYDNSMGMSSTDSSNSNSNSNSKNGASTSGSAADPPVHAISLEERAMQMLTEQQGSSGGARLEDGGGSRVNRESNQRNYELGNYERSVMVHPDRHRFAPEEAGEKVKLKVGNLASTGVPYETAGVTNKIKNIHHVGGERVKEMDHFVAAVATPVVEVFLKDKHGKVVSSKDQNDIGAHVAACTRDVKMRTARAHNLTLPGHLVLSNNDLVFPMLVENKYTAEIVQYGQTFLRFLCDVFHVLGLPLRPRYVQLYYMTTLRMDDLVCCMSPTEKRLFINVQAFQQQMYASLEQPGSINSESYGEALSSWVSRVHLAIRDERWRDVAWIAQSRGSTGEQRPTKGMYCRANREELERMKTLYTNKGCY